MEQKCTCSSNRRESVQPPGSSATTNFSATLTPIQSDLAQEIFKDPYKFDFLKLSKVHLERDLEEGLVSHMTKLLMELGHGFSYVGRQYP